MTTYPLHDAVLRGSRDDLLRAIAEGAELNALDDRGQTALHWAVFRGDYKVVTLLLERGANPNVLSEDGVCLVGAPRISA